jgi:CTP synthase
LEDAYISVREALKHAGLAHNCDIDIAWINSEHLERGRDLERLEDVAGIVVPGGFGYRGIEGKIVAARYAREKRVPYLGLCLGLQVMVIELARHALGSDEPNSTEFDIATKYPVIDLMPDQRDISDMGGTMRLGLYPCCLVPGTKAARAYKADMVFSGLSPDNRLIEVAELAYHPWMVGSQFHPEFKSRPNNPHPFFLGFVAAAKEYALSAKVGESEEQVVLETELEVA